MFLGCSPRVKIVQLFNYCFQFIGWENWQRCH